MMNYDSSSKSSIMAHALTILGHSLRELYPEAEAGGGKGNFGNSMEYYHFGYDNNSNPAPDFEIIGYDLKCTPLDPTADGYIAGERLVLTMIDFIKEAQANHYTESHFWEKAKLLLIFYLRIKGGPYLDYIVQMIRWWNIPEEDLKIIIDDWNKIHEKLVNGQAHNLSEGDTLYLGACTKSSDSSKRRKQYKDGAPSAKPRAYCLKKQYMYWLVVDSFLDKKNVHISSTMQLSKKYMEKVIKEKQSLGVAVKSIADYQKGETFEDLVVRKFEPYYGKTLMEISAITGQGISYISKDFAYQTCMAILGIQGRKIAEFEKAGILLKSISLGHDGKSLKESMSFPAFKYIDVAEEEEWEESGWYETISRRFFFPVFQKSQDNVRSKMILRKVFFWAMPEDDKNYCRIVWKDTRDKIRKDDYTHFIRMTQNAVSHVRPHATTMEDTYPTPAGGFEPKKCFWLNRDYILKQVNEELSKDKKIETKWAASDSLLGEMYEGNSAIVGAKPKSRTASLQGQLEFPQDKPRLLPDLIIDYLKAHPQSSIRAIANGLKVQPEFVNSMLCKNLKGRVVQDESSRWSVVLDVLEK